MIVKYSKRADADLLRLPRGIGDRIMDKIDWFALQENPLEFAKPLQGYDQKLYRFRIGDYRAIFTIEKGQVTILFVLEIQHRKDIYR